MIDSCNPLAEVAKGEASPEAVLRLGRWLRANPDGWVRLYHGTDARVPVATEGLRPTGARRRNSLQSRSGYVSFSIYPGHAEMFALTAFPQRAVTICGVNLRVRQLEPDMDQLRNPLDFPTRSVGAFGFPDTTPSMAKNFRAQISQATKLAPRPLICLCLTVTSCPKAVGIAETAELQILAIRFMTCKVVLRSYAF